MNFWIDAETARPMPYEARESLVAMMYRIASPTPSARTLVVLPTYWGELPVVGWDGDVVLRRYPFDPQELLPAASFDRVALHWVLDDVGRGLGWRRARARRLELLHEARRLLAPGGIVTGLVSNWLCVGERAGQPVVGLSAGDCRRLVRRAGFEAGEVSIALPSGDAPRSFISTSRQAARHYFRRQLAFNVGDQRSLNQALRRLLVELGVSRHLQGALVFSGRVR